MHQKIELKKTKKVTYVRFFSDFGGQEVDDSGEFSFLVTDSSGKPLRIADGDEEAIFVRNQRNNFVFNSSLKVVTGFTSNQKLSSELTKVQKDNLAKNFKERQKEKFGIRSVSEVFFETRNDIDYFVSVGISRSYETLNTLSVHNNLIGETPRLEAPTGVLFGRLEALQKIRDENGQKVRIPLANVPVAVFNSSEEFPSVSSTDQDGNRLILNLKENSQQGMYFNIESFDTDQEFLKDNSTLDSIPEKYRYTSFTNERGEFAIFDIPVGEQVFVFEVDLLKQGLSKDEVSLNFFNYPVEEDPIVDNIPHFLFRQIPVNIVPSWGDFQSGYTELDVTLPIDLRKWATYYTTPIAFAGVSLQDRQDKGFFTPLTFKVRDMGRQGFPIKRMEVVEISDLLRKDFDQQLMWEEEFKQTKNKAEFRKNDYQAFKLPANIYDPDGVGTNGRKGVWLCGYEIKMFYQGENDAYRVTGFERDYITSGTINRSHFDLNRHTRSTDPTTLSASTGVFPYERPWSINYPEKYSIPKIPSILNPNKAYNSITGAADSIKEPKWLDGDRTGGPLWNVETSGYGLQNMDGRLKPNIFSQRVSSGTLFKYEQGVYWEEQYSNGFHSILDSRVGHDSKVKNGERFQRLEAGYGYWLRPEGWPRIMNNNWGDHILTGDFNGASSNPIGLSPPNYLGSVVKFPGEIIAIRMESDSQTKKGAIDIYRIAEPNLLVPSGPPLVDKFASINFQAIYVQNNNTSAPPITRRLELIVDTNNDRVRYASGEGKMSIRNNGIIAVTILGVIMKPGESVLFENKIASGLNILFPSNANYNSNENSYDNASYTVTMTINIPGPSRDVTQVVSVNVSANKNTSVNYIISRINNVQTKSKIKNNGSVDCTTIDPKTHNVLIDGMIFMASDSSVGSITIGSSKISPTCTNNIPHVIL